jgi:hypothetical protein
MARVETGWQSPSADDINPDALEYLLIGSPERSVSPPWVDIITEPEPAASLTPEMLRLRTKVEILAAEVDILSVRLQQANCQIGYLLSQVSERDKIIESARPLRLPAPAEGRRTRGAKANHVRLPIDLLICALMLFFAWAVLMTLLT